MDDDRLGAARAPLRRDDSFSMASTKQTIDFRSLPCLDPADAALQVERAHSDGSLVSLSRIDSAYQVSASPQRLRAPRMLDRDGPFLQSAGRLNIRRKQDNDRSVRQLKDVFHTMVNMDTKKLVILGALFIMFSWLVFAMLFHFVGNRCGLHNDTFLKSLYLAIETLETIGYGVPDSYFNDCKSGLFVLGSAALWASIMNALIIAGIYTRISRPQSRAMSICFSEKAIISEIRGQIYFMFQVCDLRKHQLIETHVRLYCIQHAETSQGVAFQTRAMRLQHPDDELGGMLLLTLPQMVVHRVDPWSPLWPLAADHPGATPANSFQFPDILQRAADAENGNRDGGRSGAPPAPTLAEVALRVQAGQLEVLCLVEGIDPSTSSTLQARHSYNSDDIVFNASFQRCVSRDADGTCVVDFNAFHELVQQKVDEDMLVQSMA